MDFDTTIKNARIRWAQKGIQYDVNPGVAVTHTLQNCLFEQCPTGVFANLANATLNLSGVTKCSVTTPITCVGDPRTINGSMTDDCGGDTDSDCLDDDWELENFGNLNQNCFGDPDSDGLDNGEEYLWGGDPLTSDNGWPATLDIGLVLSGEQTISFSPNPAFPDNSGIGFDANKGNTADSIVVTEPVQGQLLIRWNSTFIQALAEPDPPVSDE